MAKRRNLKKEKAQRNREYARRIRNASGRRGNRRRSSGGSASAEGDGEGD